MAAPVDPMTFWNDRIEPATASADQPLWSDDFLNSALTGAGVGAWQVDMETGLATWDETTSAILGLDPVKLTTDALLPVHPDDQDLISAALNRSVKTGAPYDMIFRVLAVDGEVRWLHGRGGAFPPGSKNPRYIAGVVSDVTERNQAIEARKESERQLASIIENLPGMVYCCEVDPPWRTSFISEAVTGLTGYASEDFLSGKLAWDQIIAPEDRAAVAAQVADALDRRSKFELRYRIMHRSGDLRWVQERGGAVYSATGEPLFLEGFIGDVHEQTLSEHKIRHTEERLRRAAQATRDTVWDLDLATDTIAWDAAAGETLGYSPGELGTDRGWWLSRVHPEDRSRVEGDLAAVIAGGRDRLEVEYRFRNADGEYSEIFDRAYLIRDEHNRPTRLVGAMHDQTERKSAILALMERESRLQKIFEQALVGIMESGPDGRVQLVNSRFCEIVGRSAEELRSCTMADFTHPDDLNWNLQLVEEKMAAGEPFQVEKRYVRPNGETVWCNVSVSYLTSADGMVEKSIVLLEDITARKADQAALSNSEMLYRSVVEASTDCIKIIDLEGTIQFINSPGLRAFGCESADQVVGQKWRELWPKAHWDTIDAALEAASSGESIRFSGNRPTEGDDQTWWDVSVTPMLTDKGRVDRILAISRDVTVQRRTSDELKWASEHDALTKLPNRRAFEARLQAATIRAMGSGRSVGLLLLDLDHFKHINDTLGHAAGDHLLTILGSRLKDCVRANDFAARLGGDEFAVILEEGGDHLDLKASGESILDRLRQPVRLDGRMVNAGGSIGGACFPADAQNADELLRNADIALYALKASGRGGTRMFHQHMREHAQVVSSQLSLARAAISQKSVEPHYQQKVELASGRVAGLEALLRWRHGTRGIQLPDTVSEAFNDYELATNIGDLVQRRVLGDLRAWVGQRFSVGSVAINAAPAEFLRDDFAERLLAKIHEADVPASMIEIEVTEHVFFESASQYVARALQELNKAGVRIALDDFGTGYSSLSHLRDFPVDVVKIDKSFVAKMISDAEVRAIVSAVIDLARSLKIDVVAEGIETEAQFNALVKEGCLLGQGYYFGRAVEADEVPQLIRRATSKLRLAG